MSRRAGVAAAVAALLATLAAAVPARAAPPPVSPPPPDALPETPADYSVPAARAIRIANRDPKVAAEARSQGVELTEGITPEAVRRWEVGYYADGEKVVLVVVDGESGEITESWTGEQVDWPMARGHESQFGHLLNSPWVWLPMAAVFLLGLLDWRRPMRIVHLDLLVLLSFGVSEAFFNAADIGVSVPLYYPPLLYLLARVAWLGFRGRSGGLNPSAPLKVLVVAAVLLALFRVTLNIADSGVIDVGYAGVIGADRIADAEPIYGEGAFPSNNPTGDTYGPANYFAYVPFEQALPWSGAWDELPAAHAAAIFFDLATVAGLFLLGRALGGGRSRAGNRLGAILAFAWLAYPFSDYVLQSNSNDSLVAALLVWSLVAFASPLARGALLGVAAMTKFAPLALAPLYLTGHRGLLGWAAERRSMLRRALLCAVGLLAAVVLLAAHPAVDPGLATFWERTVASQVDRVSPFSIWGQTDLDGLHRVVEIVAAGLAVAVALVPRRRALATIAALGAAVMIAVQLTAEHWFYLYIVWFLPMLLVALAAPDADPDQAAAPG